MNRKIIDTEKMSKEAIVSALIISSDINIVDLERGLRELQEGDYAEEDSNGYIRLTELGQKTIDEYLAGKSEGPKSLALRLKELYPKGRRNGGNQAWAESESNIKLKLDLWRKKFPSARKYGADAIVEATRKYVEHFNGDYTYMRTLRYFIMKDDAGEIKSDLLNILEDPDYLNDDNNDYNGLNIVF